MAERILFVTGRLAEPALRRLLANLAERVGFDYDVAVLPITVAALAPADWVARKLTVPAGVTRVILPGAVRGDLGAIQRLTAAAVERGPRDLRDLPAHFGRRVGPPEGYGAFDIEIIAEVNHAPRMTRGEVVSLAKRYAGHGADVIDIGCDPGSAWAGVGDAVRALRDEGLRVSIDSFDPREVASAVSAGAELVLSVNGSNADRAADWGVEVVAIPDTPDDLAGLLNTAGRLDAAGVSYRLDPILEPIGLGFAASLGRYLEVRRLFPDAELMMGVGNLTELTDVDSAGLNVVLAGFCQEVGVRSVLTTEVINWAGSSVRELAAARRLVKHACGYRTLPKYLEPGLVMMRDVRRHEVGAAGLRELADRVTDPNYRIFAERGELHILNGRMYLHGNDPFALFAEVCRRDPKMDPSHAFYLGYEFAKAVTALTLDKEYAQDRALDWGILTVPERPHARD